jgi:rare lipoprotein A
MHGRTALVIAALALPIPATADTNAAKVGLASYYARSLHGNVTASGTKFDNTAMVAAHPTYPFGTVVRVTNLINGRSVNVRIVDRGPVPRIRKAGVIIDVSRAAAEKLGFLSRGRTRVRVVVLSEAPD